MARISARVAWRTRQHSAQAQSVSQLQHIAESGIQQRVAPARYNAKNVCKLIAVTGIFVAFMSGSLYAAAVMLARRWLYLVIAIDALVAVIFVCIVFATFRKKEIPAIPASALAASLHRELFGPTSENFQTNLSSTDPHEDSISESQQSVCTECASAENQPVEAVHTINPGDRDRVTTRAVVHSMDANENTHPLPPQPSAQQHATACSTPDSVRTRPGQADGVVSTPQAATPPVSQPDSVPSSMSPAPQAATPPVSQPDSVPSSMSPAPQAATPPVSQPDTVPNGVMLAATEPGVLIEFKPLRVRQSMRYDIGSFGGRFPIFGEMAGTVRKIEKELGKIRVPKRLSRPKRVKRRVTFGGSSQSGTHLSGGESSTQACGMDSPSGSEFSAVSTAADFTQQKDALPPAGHDVLTGGSRKHEAPAQMYHVAGAVAESSKQRGVNSPSGSEFSAVSTAADSTQQKDALPPAGHDVLTGGSRNDLDAKPIDFQRRSTWLYGPCKASATPSLQVIEEYSEEEDAGMSDTALASSLSTEAACGLEDMVPSTSQRTTPLQKLKKGVKGMHKITKNILGGAVALAERSLRTGDMPPSQKYGFKLISEFRAKEDDDMYLLIREKSSRCSTKGPTFAQIVDTETRSFWLQSGFFYTERGHVAISDLEYTLLHKGHYYSPGHIVVKLNARGDTIRTVLTHADACCQLSMLQWGRTGRDLVLSTQTDTSTRVSIFKLMSLSATLQDCKQAFFYAYTEHMIHAAVSYVSEEVHKRFAMHQKKRIEIHDAFDEYTKQDPAGMSDVITSFLLLSQLGRVLSYDIRTSIMYIRTLIQCSASSYHYPEHHALFWKIVTKQESCLKNAESINVQTANGEDFIIDLHLICALVCSRDELINRKQVCAFVNRIMLTYDKGLDANSTRIAHYLAFATVASPKLLRGIKALRVPDERWQKLLHTVSYTFDLYMEDTKHYCVHALSVMSGEKHPCRVNAVLLSNFTRTTSYRRAVDRDCKLVAIDAMLGPRYTPHQLANKPQLKQYTRTKNGALRPYAILIANLQRVYMYVEQGRYSRDIVLKLLRHWESLQVQQKVGIESESSIYEPLRLSHPDQDPEMHHAPQSEVATYLNTVMASCAAHHTSYPFSKTVLKEIGNTALTGFLSMASVASVSQEFSFLKEVCSVNVGIGDVIRRM